MSISTRWSPPEIDFSTFPDSDGLPMADTEANQDQMIDLIQQTRQALAPLGHHAGGNLLVYYDPDDGWKHLSPDVFVALHAGSARRASWKTWVEGKFPEVVIEVASPSTQARDIRDKVTRYLQLGAREYYVFDPAGELDPAFRGYRFEAGRVEVLPNAKGVSIMSPLLDREWRVVDGWLRLIDPATDMPYPLLADERARADMEHARASEEAAARSQAEAEVSRLRAELARLQGDS